MGDKSQEIRDEGPLEKAPTLSSQWSSGIPTPSSRACATPTHGIQARQHMVSTLSEGIGLPFKEVSKMELRRRLAGQVLDQGVSLSEACRLAGVTRKTGRKWMERARLSGIDQLCELSRAPHLVVRKTSEQLESNLVALKMEHPEWGPRKLVELLRRDQGLQLPLRTAERILHRRGLTVGKVAQRQELVRFEREECGLLLQMDFKGLPISVPYSLLTVLDDHARYCLALSPVPDKTSVSVRGVLWDLFGTHGLPRQMLMDNGDCWGTGLGPLPTRFEVWLMKLGVQPIHGRPGHPQTQGKVERFHSTVKTELKERLMQPSIEEAKKVVDPFVDRYNWVRPHDALQGQTPGSLYKPFAKKRPNKLPEHIIDQGLLSRKVAAEGFISFRGKEYRLGKGLIGERVVLTETEAGWLASFNGFDLIYLHQVRHT
jgi:transposase InsO family protein